MNNVIIQTQGLTKRYGEITAVNNLNLEISRGEIFGLLGPNGAGKTTTTLMLLGMTEPTEGKAIIDGFDCTRNPIAVKRIAGYLPDSVGFYPDMTGRENLRFTGRLNGLDRDACDKRANALLDRVGMTYAADRKTGEYSRGMKQRLGIADVLMKDPKVIVMDEPTLGIDPAGMQELISLMKELAAHDGRTLLISSHQLHQIQQVCDRVGIFVKGDLIACGQINELGRQLENEGLYSVELQAQPPDESLKALIMQIDGIRNISESIDSLIIESGRDIRRDLTSMLASKDYTILQLRHQGGDLDEIYRRFFEKAGEKDDNADGERKSSGLRSLFRKKAGA